MENTNKELKETIKYIEERLDSTIATRYFLVSPLTEDTGLFMVYTYDVTFIIKYYDTGLVECFFNGILHKYNVTTIKQYDDCVQDIVRILKEAQYPDKFTDDLEHLIR